MAIQFAGIRRKTEYSPNHISNDLQILSLTAQALEGMGCEVTLYDEGRLSTDNVTQPFIFSMTQGPEGTAALKDIAQRGTVVINTPESVENCWRINMTRLLLQCGIPFPKSIIIPTSGPIAPIMETFSPSKLWIKRGDVHAVHKEDVTLTYTVDELSTTLQEFTRRGIRSAVVQEHCDGDVVKFYAIRESDFFYWYYLNGVNHTPFRQKQLHELAEASAEALGLYVFGGDAIIAPDGWITIIDINDWPSFAPVRDMASQQIAQLLHRKAVSHDR
jgi:glutathione synthase/RimK-type ligase-like ATP-grasp enzyme